MLPQVAAARAITNCIAGGGVPVCCKIELTVQQRVCAAIAWRSYGEHRFAYAGEDTLDAAKDRALSRCQNAGFACDNVIGQCRNQ